MPSEYANDLMARVGLDTTEWKKGITDLNAGIKHIETGFQASAALMDDWSNNSDGLRKRIETLNDKLALQQNKLELLKKAYEEEVAQNGESSKAAEELAKKMYATQNEIKRTESSIGTFTDKLVDLEDTAGKVADKLDGFANKTKTLSAACAGALAAIGAGLVKAGTNADELNTLAKQTGLTVEEIQKFQYASDLIDVELDDMTKSLQKMTKNMVSTSSEVKNAWDTLGVSTHNANGTSRDAVEVFYEVLEALSNVRNETDRDQLAMQLFGKSANDLAGIVDDGGRVLKDLGQEAESLGLIMSKDAVDGANEFNDAIDSMKAKVSASLGKAFSENADKLAPAMESLADAVVSVVNAFANMPAGAQKTAVGLLAVGAAISPVLSAGSKVASLVSKIKKMKLAKSLKDTSSAAQTAASSASGFGSALKGSLPIIAAVVVALGVLKDAYEDAKAKIVDSINERYDAEQKYMDELYADETNWLNKKLDQIYDSNAEALKNAEDTYDATIQAAEEHVSQQKKLIEVEEKAREKSHKREIERIEAERSARKKAVDEATSHANAKLQAQIDAIDSQIAAEAKAKKAVDDAQKKKDLETAVAAARTMADKRAAEKALTDFLAELEAEKAAEARESLKSQLQAQIDANNDKATAQKDSIDQELDLRKQSLETEYEMYKENLDLRLEALETYVEEETQKAQEALDRAVKDANDAYDRDTQKFKEHLDNKTKAYNEYIENLQSKRDQEIEDVEPGVTDFVQELVPIKYDATTSAQKSIWNKMSAEQQNKVLSQMSDSERRQFLNSVEGNAKGTDYWRGGLTRINEEGGEILNLPRGTQIIPHDVSVEMARSYGKQAAITNSTTNTTNNSYNYGAQQQVTVLEVSGERVATVIQPTVSVGMARNNRSRGRALGVGNKRV